MSAANLVRYNARRCEEAKSPGCSCHCGGKFHGQAHSEQWIAETIDTLRAAERMAAAPPQAELFGASDPQVRS